MNTPQVCCIGEGLIVLVADDAGPLEDAAAFTRSVGGAEVNVAIGLRHSGIDTALLTRVGDDGFGRHLVAVAAAQGVDVSGVEVDDARTTGMYVKERGGETARPTDLGAGNSRMHYFRAGSASSAFSPEYLSRPVVRELLAGARLVHTTGITPALSPGALAMTVELLGRPRGRTGQLGKPGQAGQPGHSGHTAQPGQPGHITQPGHTAQLGHSGHTAQPTHTAQLVSFDVNWRPALWRGREQEGIEALRALSALADVVLIGASEAVVLYGTSDPAAVRAALPEPRWLIMKNDGAAATGFDGASRVDVAAFSADVVEAIGAGDAFAAGFLSALLGDRSLEECLRSAHTLALAALGSTGDHVGAPAAPPATARAAASVGASGTSVDHVGSR